MRTILRPPHDHELHNLPSAELMKRVKQSLHQFLRSVKHCENKADAALTFRLYATEREKRKEVVSKRLKNYLQ